MNTTESFRYMSFNLCNIPQMDKDKAYNGLRFNDRLDRIVSVIKAMSPDVLGFQEVRDYEGGNVMSDLWGRLGSLGYRIKFQEGSPHEFAVYNAIAYKTAKVWPQTVTAWWNSDTPDLASCTYGNGWPRAVLATEFYPIKQQTVHRQKQGSGEAVSFNRPGPDYSSPALLVVNSHLGLGIGTSHPKEKVLSNQTTVEQIKKFVGSKPTFVVSLGDFNSFKDGQYFDEEMSVYKDNGFIDAVTAAPLTNQDSVPVSGTFTGFSPDPFKSSDTQFRPPLSHMQWKCLNQDSKWSVAIKKCFVCTLTGTPELDARKVEKEADLLQMDGSTLRDKYPSDHLPVVLDFELAKGIL